MTATSLDLSQIRTDALSAASTFRTLIGLGTSAILNAGSANGVATLGADSKLTAAQIPDISLISYLGSVASQAAMLALSGQQGDWCVRSDLSTTWVITGSDPTLLANWTQLSYPSVPVQSVFGRTGAVVGVSTDYSAVGITNTAIGASNPSTGAFTSLSASDAVTITQGTANTSVLTSTGYSLTGSNAQSLIDIAGTWNTSGTPTAIKLNITDSASASDSLLLDLQVGGTSKASVSKTGAITVNASASTKPLTINRNGVTFFTVNEWGSVHVFSSGVGYNYNANDANAFRADVSGFALTSNRINIRNASTLNWSSTTNWYDTSDLTLARDAAGVLAQRNGASAQTYRLYNTYTSATSFENLQLQWASNEARIGTSVGATAGTQRDLVLGSWAANGTWTAGLTMTPAGAVTLSGNTSASKFFATATGGTVPEFSWTGRTGTGWSYFNNGMIAYTNSSYPFYIRPNGVTVSSISYYSFASGSDSTVVPSLAIMRQSANVIEINNGQLVSGGGSYRNIAAGAATFSGDVTVSAVNIVTDTTTGTKIGTGTTQKLGFWNATPVVQPANTTAIDDVLVNTGLRASGGVNNFNNTLDLTIRTVTYGATMAIDAALGNKVAITLTGNGTISNPTNSVDGRVLVFRLRQDGSGNRVPVWDTKYAFVGDLATVTLSTGANKIDRVAFEYDSTDDKWYCISFIKGS